MEVIEEAAVKDVTSGDPRSVLPVDKILDAPPSASGAQKALDEICRTSINDAGWWHRVGEDKEGSHKPV